MLFKPSFLLPFVLVVFLVISFLLGWTPPLLSSIFVLVSLITYVVYSIDKSAARSGSWRVSENTLHLLSLCFGWPGALVAQETLRHKTQKESFRGVFWMTVIVNCGLLIWLHTNDGFSLAWHFMMTSQQFCVELFGASVFSQIAMALTTYQTG